MRAKPGLVILALVLGLLFIVKGGLAMTINTPEGGLTYPYSVLDVNFTDNLTGTKTCYYSFGMAVSYVIQDCSNISVEFPINKGHINLTLTEINDTDHAQDTLEVWIDNDLTTGKAVLVLGLLVVFFLLPFIFWYPCFKLDSLHTPIKLLLTLLGFFGGFLFLTLGQTITEHYVHNPGILGHFESIIVGYRWIFYFIIAYFLISFMFNIFENVVRRKQ